MKPRRTIRGFTLVEVIVSVTVSAMTLAATLSVVLFIARTGASASNYVLQANDARRALATFAQDARQATDCIYHSENSVTLTVPAKYAANSNQVTYAQDGAGNFKATSGATVTRLCGNVTRATFAGFDRSGNPTTASRNLKLVQLTINLRQTPLTTVAQDTLVLSARQLLRNKPSQ